MAVPSATYRVQLRGEFGFAELSSIADYLAELGVGAAYTSPLLQAAAGSTHGYDVVDPTRVSDQLGGQAGRRRLLARLAELGLGLVVDIVPNHMDVSEPAANRWWWDVLARGAESAYARYFDIDFTRGPLLIPVLADDGDDGASARTELAVVDNELRYHQHRFPIAAGTGGDNAVEVHERQHYRLVSWRRAADQLNYRRFFDVTNLAGVRVEDEDVFAATHAEILRWVRAGEVDGLRVDHVDGLADPGEYLRRLRSGAKNTWLLVEKILAVEENLPAHWPVDGTTGYESLREICGVFIDAAGEAGLSDLCTELCGRQELATLERDCKREVVNGPLRTEVTRIARLLDEVPISRARDAVAELLAVFPVYRSYLPDGWDHLIRALTDARGARPELTDVLNVLGHKLWAQPDGELAIRFQQTSAMVMAKGVEDTAYYRYPRLVALNEVGGDLGQFGVSVARLHAVCAQRAARCPNTMTTLSTHDTKRGEDVRAWIAVLAEIPGEFGDLVRQLRQRHPLPEPTIELLGWQTLLGVWPAHPERLIEYLRKAAREAKLRTTWTDNDVEFEKALADWVHAVLGDQQASALLAAFAARIRPAGWSNSLGQKLIQLAGPGVPDIYQGTELWDDSLVDPDNRRPVDFASRRELLDRLRSGAKPDIDDTGAAKLLVVWRALRLRREEAGLFQGYQPLWAQGPAATHAVAFGRGTRRHMVAVATRLPIGLAARGGWADTVLPLPADAYWTDVFTENVYSGRHIELSRLLAKYPVALLRQEAR